MRLMDMTDGDVWDLMLSRYPNFYTGEKGGDEEDGVQQEPDDCD